LRCKKFKTKAEEFHRRWNRLVLGRSRLLVLFASRSIERA